MAKKNQVPNRTLVLRICDERLQARLREKMAAVEEEVEKAAAAAAAAAAQSNQRSGLGGVSSSHFPQHQFGSAMAMPKQETKILDLAGVTCEPPKQGGPNDVDPTLWNFTCDGATYPARLTNLPCPVELHKTHDHAMYYKCTDVAQMLIVYEDMTALEEAESMPRYKVDGFPSYYHSGLTPPTSRIVEKRFKERVHPAVPPPFHEIKKVEKDLIDLMESISTKDTAKTKTKTKTKKNTKPALNKVLEEVEEVVVDYEPWMDEGGEIPDGIEFTEDDEVCKLHPEVWLHPWELREEPKPAEPALASTSSTSLQTPSQSKKQKNLTPDAPVDINTTSESAATTSKKKKPKSTEKKKKSKKKKSTEKPVVPDPAMDLSQTSALIGEGAEASVPQLDEFALNMDVLDGIDLDGLDAVDDLDNDELLFM